MLFFCSPKFWEYSDNVVILGFIGSQIKFLIPSTNKKTAWQGAKTEQLK